MQRFRASDGAELAYTERGEGLPAILFIHGWQADNTAWAPVMDALGSNVHAVAVDLRGSGASRTAAGPYDLERFAADLRELIEGRAITPAVLVGHSMGATVALRLAVDSPQVVAGLVLIAPVPASGGRYSPKGEAFLKSTAGDPVVVRKWLARTFAGKADETVFEQLSASAAMTGREAALESLESWAHADFADATRAIAAPVLVIAPQHDIPEVHDREVAALLHNARYVILPDSAHYAILEKPREIAAMIREFASFLDSAQGDAGQ
jgi:pimeloyl-ACP methyl ester carboxylesterase